ncbi:hypothetical protein LTSESEN_2650 [Salmonella enterica subsp. enterica serovar Senftenberg str. A4-543]|uniref:Cytoplasmic protein n=1 Tax=Salmonella enterica subsp. enterica serovar Senftenberg str. A4-543 TaxID=913082 RepID=G5R086_SALSE|nr:hypothetical protein LTSESEN_2650 [Salmonella enterica subsp. enterica serovar Senftenberg str. A4-543]
MNALEPLFARLARSTFRSRFRLGIKERQYCWDKGAEVIDKHAADFTEVIDKHAADGRRFYRPATGASSPGE